MNKHTPGPWIAKYMRATTGENEYWICFDAFASIACVRHGADDEEYGGHESLVANANLIAAAPEMYSIIERLDYFSEALIHKEYEVGSETIKELVELAKSVLKKARGET